MRIAILGASQPERMGHVLAYARGRAIAADVFAPPDECANAHVRGWIALYGRLGLIARVRDTASFASECGSYTHVFAMTPADAESVPSAESLVVACILDEGDPRPTRRVGWYIFMHAEPLQAVADPACAGERSKSAFVLPAFATIRAKPRSARPCVALVGAHWARLSVAEIRASLANFDELSVLIVAPCAVAAANDAPNVDAVSCATPETMLDVVARAHYVVVAGEPGDATPLGVHLALATGTRLVVSAEQNALLGLRSALVVETCTATGSVRVPALGSATDASKEAVHEEYRLAAAHLDATYARIMSSEPPGQKRRVHVLGLPHTVVSDAYSHCAFTGKVLRFARMMQPLGYTVVEYSNGESESGADVHVQILSSAELRALTKRTSDSEDYSADVNNAELVSEFSSRLLRAVSALAAPSDIVCHVFGPDQSVVLALPECIHVESGIGYTCVEAPCPYRIYESAAWMHWHFGRRHLEFGKNYEFVAPNYYDCGEWDVVEDPPETPRVLFFGRLVESKGLATVIAAARAMPSVTFVLCGQGDASLASEANTVYAPPAFGRARSAVLGAATALLAPSAFIEPFCGSAVEAQMCGTPVICSSFGAFTETVEDGATGYRCHTLADFVVAITRAVLLDRRYIAWRARRMFSLETVGRRYDEIFSDILDLRGAGWYTSVSHKFGCVAQRRRIPDVVLCTATPSDSAASHVRYFDAAGRDSLVSAHFPQFLEHYRNLAPEFQPDLWRLMALYVHGGTYVDDAAARLPELLESDSLVFRATRDGPDGLDGLDGLDVIAASAGSRALHFAVEHIVRSRLEPRERGECYSDVSGHRALGRAVRAFLRGSDDDLPFVPGDYGDFRVLERAASEASRAKILAWRDCRVFNDIAARSVL
jgi:glycosyltransferase involved in cell wall biosynthesis